MQNTYIISMNIVYEKVRKILPTFSLRLYEFIIRFLLNQLGYKNWLF